VKQRNNIRSNSDYNIRLSNKHMNNRTIGKSCSKRPTQNPATQTSLHEDTECPKSTAERENCKTSHQQRSVGSTVTVPRHRFDLPTSPAQTSETDLLDSCPLMKGLRKSKHVANRRTQIRSPHFSCTDFRNRLARFLPTDEGTSKVETCS